MTGRNTILWSWSNLTLTLKIRRQKVKRLRAKILSVSLISHQSSAETDCHNIDAPGAGWRMCWRLSLCSARRLIAATVVTPWTWSVTSAAATRRPRTSAAWWPPPSLRGRQQESLPDIGQLWPGHTDKNANFYR